MNTPYWYQVLRAILELLYFFSGIVLAVGLIVAIQQLRLAKKDLRTRYRREAVMAALEQSRRFAQFLEHYPTHCHVIVDGSPTISLVRWSLANVAFDLTSLDVKGNAGNWITTLAKSQPRFAAVITVCNELESFALPFAKGAADESTAYDATAIVFCELVETYAPALIALRQRLLVDSATRTPVASGPYLSTIKLYEVWRSRLTKDALSAQAKALEAQALQITVAPLETINADQEPKRK